LVVEIDALRGAASGPVEPCLHGILDKVLGHFDCAVGTIHRLDPSSGMLCLCAHRGIPEGLLSRVREIPIGKGMAGLAAERRQPVQVCNLQADLGGVANPAARETRMEGSIAVPILAPQGVRGVLGVAKPVAYEFSELETSQLLEIAEALGRLLESDPLEQPRIDPDAHG
jgi:putative methionine-R-sulfoxide reductase with GAF domain